MLIHHQIILQIFQKSQDSFFSNILPKILMIFYHFSLTQVPLKSTLNNRSTICCIFEYAFNCQYLFIKYGKSPTTCISTSYGAHIIYCINFCLLNRIFANFTAMQPVQLSLLCFLFLSNK